MATGAATVVFAPGTNITTVGTSMPHAEAVRVAEASGERRAAGAGSLGIVDVARLGGAVEVGDPGIDLALSRPATIVLADQPVPATVYHMDSAGATTMIDMCGSGLDPAGGTLVNGDGTAVPFCYTVSDASGATADYTIYTSRLSVFFTVASGALTCSISLGTETLSFGEMDVGQAAMGEARQTIRNEGTARLSSVSVSATPWTSSATGEAVMDASATRIAADAANPAWMGMPAEVPGLVPDGDTAVRFSLDASNARSVEGQAEQYITYTASCAAQARQQQ